MEKTHVTRNYRSNGCVVKAKQGAIFGEVQRVKQDPHHSNNLQEMMSFLVRMAWPYPTCQLRASTLVIGDEDVMTETPNMASSNRSRLVYSLHTPDLHTFYTAKLVQQASSELRV